MGAWESQGFKGLEDGLLEPGLLCALKTEGHRKKTKHKLGLEKTEIQITSLLLSNSRPRGRPLFVSHFKDKADRCDTNSECSPWCCASLGGRKMLFSAPSWTLGT